MEFIFGIAVLVVFAVGLNFGLPYFEYLVLKFRNSLNKKLEEQNKKEGE